MQRGFTLIEVMVAAAILSIGALGVLGLLLTAMNGNRDAHDKTSAITLAEQQLGELESLATVWDGRANKTSENLLASLAGYAGDDEPVWLGLNVASDGKRTLSSNSVTAVNLNGIAPATTGSNAPPPGRFYIGFYVLSYKIKESAENGDTSFKAGKYCNSDFVRGAIRVTWNRKGYPEANDGCSNFATFDTLSAVNTNCLFITLPFAFQRQAGTGTPCS